MGYFNLFGSDLPCPILHVGKIITIQLDGAVGMGEELEFSGAAQAQHAGMEVPRK